MKWIIVFALIFSLFGCSNSNKEEKKSKEKKLWYQLIGNSKGATIGYSSNGNSTTSSNTDQTEIANVWGKDFIKNLSIGDCKAIASSDKFYCTTADCRAIASNDQFYCKTNDCKGVVMKDTFYCNSNLCRAWVKKDSFYCNTDDNDCKGIARNDTFYCDSNRCKAIVKKDTFYCY